MKQIICIGNRYVAQDAAGPRVYDFLMRQTLPDDIAVIDGGLMGLDLLRFLEKAARVVFVDRCVGTDGADPVVVLEANDIIAEMSDRFDHAAGLPYLLRVLPLVCKGALPYVTCVGIAGDIDIDQQLIEKAAMTALAIIDKTNDAANGDMHRETANQ